MEEVQNNGNILSVPPVPLKYKKGIGQILFDKMIENKDYIAQIDGLTGEKDYFGSVLQRSIRTAIIMRSKGITRKDIITVCSFNHLDTNIPIFASLFLGAKTASTDPTLSLTDTVYLFKQIKPKMIFVSPNAVKLVEDALQEIGIDSEIVVFGKTSKHTKFSEFLIETPEEKTFVPVEITDLKETVSIFFSSGTSGMPKGICINHLAVLAQIPDHEKPHNPLVFLFYSTPYWISSFVFAVSTAITGQCKVVLPNFETKNVWNIVEKYKVSFIFLSPSQAAAVLSYGQPNNNTDLSSLKVFFTAGAPISKEQLEKIKTLLPGRLVIAGYGQTELSCGGIGFKFTNPKHLKFLLEKPTSCGKPQPGYSCKIVDPETEEILGPNQKGELRIKTEYQMNGYYNMDSSDAWDKEGFLKTGDIAYYDEDYCFFIVDRLKEMLKFQSWQIAPAKLEEILTNHPAIENAVVVGLPHPTDGDHPLAIVVLNKSNIKTTPEEIEKYVEERVDDKQRLRGGVKIVETIPVTPTGKFNRKLIKNLIYQGQL